jgi:hypothetical protein
MESMMTIIQKDVILVTGSIFVAAAARDWWKQRSRKKQEYK